MFCGLSANKPSRPLSRNVCKVRGLIFRSMQTSWLSIHPLIFLSSSLGHNTPALVTSSSNLETISSKVFFSILICNQLSILIHRKNCFSSYISIYNRLQFQRKLSTLNSLQKEPLIFPVQYIEHLYLYKPSQNHANVLLFHLATSLHQFQSKFVKQ